MIRVRASLHDQAFHPVDPTQRDRNVQGYASPGARVVGKEPDTPGTNGQEEPGHGPVSESPRDLRHLAKRSAPCAKALPSRRRPCRRVHDTHQALHSRSEQRESHPKLNVQCAARIEDSYAQVQGAAYRRPDPVKHSQLKCAESKLSPRLNFKPEITELINDCDQLKIATWANPNHERVANAIPFV